MDCRTGAAMSIVPQPISKEYYGKVGPRVELNSGIEVQRNTSDILDAFRANPYTHSLTTSV